MIELTDAEARSLSHRLGEKEFERRIRIERKRTEEWFRGDLNAMCLRMRWLTALTRSAFRLTGLYKHGRRQYHKLELSEREQTLARLPVPFDGFRILHLSDLHIDLDEVFAQKLLEGLRDASADICVITGDFKNFTVGDDTVSQRLLRPILSELASRMPVYGVLGNHDSITGVPALEAMGVKILLNEREIITRGDSSICLAGVDDPNIYKTDDIARALGCSTGGMTKILLAHSPAIHRKAAEAGIDFVMSGHIHGGQICPLGGLILFARDKSPRRVWKGPWHERSTIGYTSRGTGGCGVPIRLCCPAEIVTHILRPAPSGCEINRSQE